MFCSQPRGFLRLDQADDVLNWYPDCRNSIGLMFNCSKNAHCIYIYTHIHTVHSFWLSDFCWISAFCHDYKTYIMQMVFICVRSTRSWEPPCNAPFAYVQSRCLPASRPSIWLGRLAYVVAQSNWMNPSPVRFFRFDENPSSWIKMPWLNGEEQKHKECSPKGSLFPNDEKVRFHRCSF